MHSPITTFFYYDSAGRMTNTTYPGSKVVSYSYNALGQLTKMTDGARTLTYGYGNQGLLSSWPRCSVGTT